MKIACNFCRTRGDLVDRWFYVDEEDRAIEIKVNHPICESCLKRMVMFGKATPYIRPNDGLFPTAKAMTYRQPPDLPLCTCGACRTGW